LFIIEHPVRHLVFMANSFGSSKLKTGWPESLMLINSSDIINLQSVLHNFLAHMSYAQF